MSETLFDELTVGDALAPVAKEVTQETLNRYAEASGDHNPLHTDPEFASHTRFKSTIAHGMLTLAFISQMMTERFGAAWIEGGELELNFLAPVFPGDSITAGATVIEKNDETRAVTCEVYCDNQQETRVVAGRASVNLAAAPPEATPRPS